MPKLIGVGKCEHICTSLHSSPPGNIQAPIIKTLLWQLINMPAHRFAASHVARKPRFQSAPGCDEVGVVPLIRGDRMTDNTLSRLGRQIAARLPADLDHELHGYLRELPARSSKAVLRAQLEAALANYHGPVTLCPPAPPPEPDYGAELDLVDDDEVDKDTVIPGRPSG